MELHATTQGTQDEREWELADEELDRSGDDSARGCSFPFTISTSRPKCSRCHCR